MQDGWLTRMRWRRRGAWMWPAFVLLTIADGVIGHALPISGETQEFLGAALIGGVVNLFVIAVLAGPLAAGIRRVRGDLPRLVARDYAGAWLVICATAAMLAAGIIHHPMIARDERARADASVRAQAWIGDHAPAEFRLHIGLQSTLTIEPGRIFRTCVPSATGPRTFCVVVKIYLPLQRSVTFAGYESNAIFSGAAR